MHYTKEKIVLALLFLLALLIMACGALIVTGVHAEEAAPRIDRNDACEVVSPYMYKSDFPIDLAMLDCIRIDLNTEVLPSGNVMDGEFIFSSLPATLDLVFLYDGYHLMPVQWYWTDANCIHISLDINDI